MTPFWERETPYVLYFDMGKTHVPLFHGPSYGSKKRQEERVVKRLDVTTKC